MKRPKLRNVAASGSWKGEILLGASRREDALILVQGRLISDF